MARGEGMLVINNLTGGLATRPNPLIAEGASIKRMQSPNMRNVDLFNLGSISKRLGKTKQGATVSGSSTLASQTSENTSLSVGWNTSYTAQAYAQKFTPGSSVSINQVSLKVGFSVTPAVLPISVPCFVSIFSDSAGSPGTTLGATATIAVQASAAGTPALFTFKFSSPVAVTSGTTPCTLR